MKQILLGIVYGFIIVIVGIVAIMVYQQNHKVSMTPAVVATSTQPFVMDETEQQYAADLTKINPKCGEYYKDFASGNNPIDKELADFSSLHPLSDFLCGKYSMIQPWAKLPDGKILHFVAPVDLLNCGATGHCTYYPLLEEKKGLVRHIRGFTWYDDTGSTQDTDGTIFAWEISYDPSNNTLLVDDSHGDCGVKNTYKFNASDEPVLISASDSCLSGKGILYPTR